MIHKHAQVYQSGDPIALLDQSIALNQQSITLQDQARLAISTLPPTTVIQVTPGDSLLSVLEQAPAGATVVVSPECHTVCGDLPLTKPVTLIGASMTARVDQQAPDVTLLGCSLTGPDANGAVLSTFDRLTVQGCRISGSIAGGQHRGIYLRGSDLTFIDTSVVNCYKWDGQETQAIAGWSGIKRVLIQRCLLEAGGVNIHIGGTDPTSESDIPEDITIEGCYIRKPNEWKGWTNAKNLLELKNCKMARIENNLLEYSWVEGQVGYAVLFNVRNQEGTAPYSTIEDVTFRNNHVRYSAGGLQLLGRDYTHPSQVMKRVLIEGNVFERIEPRWGSNQRCILLAHGGEDVTLRSNHFSGSEINSFLTFEAEPWVRLCVEDNTFPEGYYGIKSDDCPLGTPTLEKYAPGYMWGPNTVVRSVASNHIPYPPGTTIQAAD